jgi:hypothetical protein
LDSKPLFITMLNSKLFFCITMLNIYLFSHSKFWNSCVL